jgi:ppGpp synthetase/RelA/SpoT-type nucleotidyltranferase
MNTIFSNLKELGDTLTEQSAKLVCQFNLFEEIGLIHKKYYDEIVKIFGNKFLHVDSTKLLHNLNFQGNEFILLSFKSYIGHIPSSSEQTNEIKNLLNRRRYNIYSKGKLWSNFQLNYGLNFYKFLDKLNDIFGETPVNYISYCYSEYKLKNNNSYLIITNDSTKQCLNGYLYLPNSSEFINKYPVLNEVKLIFEKYLKNDYLSNGEIDQEDIDKIVELKSKIGKLETEDINKITSSFKKTFKSIDVNDIDTRNRILFTALLYQYNHLPYDLYLFFKSDGDFKNLFTLMVAKEASLSLTKEEIDDLLQFVEITPNIASLEHCLFKQSNELTESMLAWKQIFEQCYDSYFTFMKSIENVCNSICRRNGIKAVITSRLKTFDSFYLKLLNRANQNEDLSTTTNLSYINIIEKPNTYHNQVFEDIRDIAGVRIVCTFDEDVWKLAELFNPDNGIVEDSDLIKLKPKYHFQNRDKCKREDSIDESENGIFNYRGFHITVKPGNNRLNLIEYKNLFNSDKLYCEIQIRSNLSHGWSEAEHPLSYKEQLGLKSSCSDYATVDKDFNEISKSLFKHDKTINKYYKLKKDNNK